MSTIIYLIKQPINRIVYIHLVLESYRWRRRKKNNDKHSVC